MKNTSVNKQKRFPLIAVLRACIQLISFIIMPALFITIFSSIGELWHAAFSGTFSLDAYGWKIVLLLAVFGTTIIFGRFFCGFVCSFGAMQDLLWQGGRHLPKKITVPAKLDKILRFGKYAVLLFIAAAVWGFGQFNWAGADPWSIFGMYFTFRGFASPAYLLSLGGALMLVIIIGSFFIERFFCKYLCPLGALFSILSRFRLLKISKPTANCGSCTLCSKKCSMSLPLSQYDSIRSGECINCMKCTSVCPRNNAQIQTVPAVSGAMAAAALMGVSYIGTLPVQSADTVKLSTDTVFSQENNVGQYKDGTYSGTAQGYHGNVSVNVTVSGGNITEITVVSHQDDNEFFERAKNSILPAVLAAQNTNVSAVSGATFSSKGIINAIADALSGQLSGDAQQITSVPSEQPSQNSTFERKKRRRQNLNENSQESSGEISQESSQESSEEVSETPVSSGYQDGTYTGTGTGFRGDTNVQVTVKNGSITDITVLSYQDDYKYFSRAQSSVLSAIISSQSINVDTVSGATFSSRGLIEAVAKALGQDYTNPNSTSERRGRH